MRPVPMPEVKRVNPLALIFMSFEQFLSSREERRVDTDAAGREAVPANLRRLFVADCAAAIVIADAIGDCVCVCAHCPLPFLLFLPSLIAAAGYIPLVGPLVGRAAPISGAPQRPQFFARIHHQSTTVAAPAMVTIVLVRSPSGSPTAAPFGPGAFPSRRIIAVGRLVAAAGHAPPEECRKNARSFK